LKILLTGGGGYIGSAIAITCLDHGIGVIVLDDLSAGYNGIPAGVDSYVGDFADADMLDRIVSEHPDIDAVVHCAAKTVVPESVADPLGYYATNVGKTITMVDRLRRHGITRVLFSSSASVYRAEDGGGISEESPVEPTSPYAWTKLMIEQVLSDAASAGQVRSIALRYFNPIGADPQLRTGLRNPSPSHVVGRLIRAWEDGRPFVVTGVDWPTSDGTGVRDFVHIWDLALAHVRSLESFDRIATAERPSCVINIGVGEAVTVRELVETFRRVVGDGLIVQDGPRRPGDVAGGYALVDRAHDLLNWRAERTVEDGIRDSLAWAEKHRGTAGPR
jgi:UDP-glucose 4-epimerase